MVVTGLLLASGDGLLAFAAATATVSTSASLSSGGDSGKKRRVLLHRLLYSGYQVGLLAVHGPQLVRFSDEEPNILVVVFAQHDAELGRKGAQEEMCEEEAGLLSARGLSSSMAAKSSKGRLAPRSLILCS